MASINTHQTTFSLVFLSIATILLLAGQAKAQDLCIKTSYPELCVAAVAGIVNPEVATEAAIKALINQVKLAKSLAAKNKAAVCSSVFGNAISDLEKSLSYLKANDKASLNINLSSALTNFVTCSDALEEFPGNGNAKAIVDTSANLRKMASNCLALATLV